MIQFVEFEYTAEYIANVFWRQHIAQVSNITLIPYLQNSDVFYVAYITIDHWVDSESAYNFVQRLKNQGTEARLVHSGDDWWAVKNNSHNSGELVVGNYTTIFDRNYYQNSDEVAVDVEEEEEYEEEYKEEYKEEEYKEEEYKEEDKEYYGWAVEEDYGWAVKEEVKEDYGWIENNKWAEDEWKQICVETVI